MFEEHDKEFLLNYGGSIMEGEQIWKWVSIVFRFGKDALFIQASNGQDGLCPQTVCFFDHLVAFSQLTLGKVDRMATITGLDHLVPFFLPAFLSQPGHISSLHYIQPSRWFSIWIKHSKSLENGCSVGCPLFILWHWKSYSEKSPCCSHFMISSLHVASLAGWCSSCWRKYLVLFQ